MLGFSITSNQRTKLTHGPVFTRASHAGLIAPKNAGQIKHDLVGILSFHLFYSAAPIKSPLVTWPFGLSVRFVT